MRTFPGHLLFCALAVLNTFIILALSKRRQLRHPLELIAIKTTKLIKYDVFTYFCIFFYFKILHFECHWKNYSECEFLFRFEQKSISDG